VHFQPEISIKSLSICNLAAETYLSKNYRQIFRPGLVSAISLSQVVVQANFCWLQGGTASAVSLLRTPDPRSRTKLMRRRVRVALLLLTSVFAVTVAQAQRLDGGLRVTVTDRTGGTVQDARVTVTNEATNVSLTANASSAGTYVFPNLLVGFYTVI